MGPNVTRLFLRLNAALRTPQEREIVRAARRSDLSRRERETEADVARRIAAVRADPRDPFRGETDEEIAEEILRRLGSGIDS